MVAQVYECFVFRFVFSSFHLTEGQLFRLETDSPIAFNEKEGTLRVEYDASRLSESVVANLMRSAGIDLLEKVALA